MVDELQESFFVLAGLPQHCKGRKTCICNVILYYYQYKTIY